MNKTRFFYDEEEGKVYSLRQLETEYNELKKHNQLCEDNINFKIDF